MARLTVEQHQHIAGILRQEILKDFSAPSCVASVRAYIEVCKRLGVRMIPMPVRVILLNAVTAAAVDAGMDLKAASHIEGGWSMAVTATGERTGKSWDGHLVAVGHGTILVDPSLDQFTRPEKDIVVEPLAVEVPPEWKKGKSAAVFQADTGVAISYMAMPSMKIADAKDWYDGSRTKKAVWNTLDKLDSEV